MSAAPTLYHFALPHRNNKRMAYWSWGDPAAKHVIVCVHGLTRQGRDFDVLAQAILDKASIRGKSVRVISVDIMGRGQSDWLDDPMGYNYPLYTQDMIVFLAGLHTAAPYATLDWVGTSMGGLIGITTIGSQTMAPPTLPVPVRRLVLNDIGPALEWSAIQRISAYVGRHKSDVGMFDTEQQAADALQLISSSFGPHSNEDWLELTRHQLKRCADGWFTFHYDPAIAVPFRSVTEEQTAAGEAMVWQLYEHIAATTLITRGAESDLLSKATAQAMTERGLKMPAPARVVEFAGVGHAPTYVAKDQHDVVTAFLLD